MRDRMRMKDKPRVLEHGCWQDDSRDQRAIWTLFLVVLEDDTFWGKLHSGTCLLSEVTVWGSWVGDKASKASKGATECEDKGCLPWRKGETRCQWTRARHRASAWRCRAIWGSDRGILVRNCSLCYPAFSLCAAFDLFAWLSITKKQVQ